MIHGQRQIYNSVAAVSGLWRFTIAETGIVADSWMVAQEQPAYDPCAKVRKQ